MLDLHHMQALVTSGALARLSEATPGVLLVMLSLADQDGRCDLTVRDLARLSGRTQVTVIKAMKELAAYGLIAAAGVSTQRRYYTLTTVTATRSEATATRSEATATRSEATATRSEATATRSEAVGPDLAPAQPQTQSHNPPIYPPKGGPTKRDPKPRAAFVVPDQHEVAAFFKANGSTGPEAGRFWNFYASKGWMVGKSKMVDWRASARNWISGRFIDGGRPSSQQPSQPYGNPALLPEDLDRMMAEARGER